MGISADPVDRQRQFDDKNNLGFPLLSDPDRVVAARMGAKRLGPLANRRLTVVIDTDRTVLDIIKSETSMTAHADQALATLGAR